MATGTLIPGWAGPSRRRVPRFQVQAPLDVTVLRSGIPDTVPGRTLNVCERGVAGVMAGELVPGESVGVEVRLPSAGDSLRARALVKYQDKLRCGLEFIGLSAEQRTAIRDWAKGLKPEAEVSVAASTVVAKKETSSAEGVTPSSTGVSGGAMRPPRRRRRWLGWAIFLLIVLIGAGVFWWRWNRQWEELEAGLKNEASATEKPRAQVPAEVMEKLLVHRVEPVYPAEARKANLQGIIALDIVVGKDGSVVNMRPLNGPDILARAATDALRWWKFDPYRVNGEPVMVETTVAVEFKR